LAILRRVWLISFISDFSSALSSNWSFDILTPISLI